MIKKRNNQGKNLSTKDKEEYLQDCIMQHMKDSIVGKLYYGINSVFKSIRRNFSFTLTESEQNQKVVSIWIDSLQENALKLGYKNKNSGNELVMHILKDINKKHGGNITITNAITKLVEQRFESVEKELAFTFLTGLIRTINRDSECYCYKPFTDTDLQNLVNVNNEQLECETEQKKSAKKYKQHYAHVEYAAVNDKNKIEFESINWLPLLKSDYLLKTPKPQQQNNNLSNCIINGASKQSSLHNDWNSIIAEMRKTYEYKKDVSDAHSSNYRKGSATPLTRLLKIGIGCSLVLMCAQGISCALTPNDTSIININDVDDLSMIGKNSSYPIDGRYNLTASFNATDFKEPIRIFNGSINGNCWIIYNLRHCLIEELAGNGTVHNLAISGANTTNAECPSGIAGKAKDNAIITFIRVEDSLFYGMNSTVNLGSVVGSLSNNVTVANVVSSLNILQIRL